LSTAGGVIEAQVKMRRRFYDRNRVPVLEGSASFVDANTLRITPRVEAAFDVRAEQIVVATGSRPYHPPELDFSHPRVRDSDSVLRYPETPFSVTIYGAGVIGCEYASIFLNMGAKVTLINTQDRLLSFMDDEIAGRHCRIICATRAASSATTSSSITSRHVSATCCCF
jgi:NAD(P) transhydrogenase